VTVVELIARDLCKAMGVEPDALVTRGPPQITMDHRYYVNAPELAWERYKIEVIDIIGWVTDAFDSTGKDKSEFYDWAIAVRDGAEAPPEPEPTPDPPEQFMAPHWRDRYGLRVGLIPR